MATWVMPSEASQSAISSNSAVVVPKRRECRMTSPSTMSVAQARIEALCTSSPAQWACRMSIGILRLGPPAAREGPRGMEQFALGAPRVRGGDRVGFDGGVEPSPGQIRSRAWGTKDKTALLPEPANRDQDTPRDAHFHGVGCPEGA